jgi:hypothetical protein
MKQTVARTSSRYVMLVIDQSFSTTRDSTGNTYEEMIEKLVEDTQLNCPKCEIGVIFFGDQFEKTVPLQPLDQWDSTDFENCSPPDDLDSGTNYLATIQEAVDVLTRTTPGHASRRIVLLTDTSLIKTGYQGQKDRLNEDVLPVLMQEGIEFVIVDSRPGDREEKWWDSLASKTGGWYSRADDLYADGAEESTRTLRWAISNESDPITLDQENTSRRFEIPPYQRKVEWGISGFNEETMSITITTPNDTAYTGYTKEDEGIPIFSVENPQAGTWTISITGTGKIYLFEEFIPRKLGLVLTDQRQSQQYLAIGKNAEVELRLQDMNEENFVVEEEVPVYGQLLSKADKKLGSLPVTFDSSRSIYTVSTKETNDLEGEYQIDIWAQPAWTETPISRIEPIVVVWGRVPIFANKLNVTSRDLKIRHPFPVTIKPENLDVIASPLQLNLNVKGRGHFEQSIEMHRKEDLYTAKVSDLSEPGIYTLTAVLEGGVTNDNVRFTETYSSPTVIEVRDLTFWERYGLGVVIASAALMLGFVLRFGYPLFFRIASGWTGDFDAAGDLIR